MRKFKFTLIAGLMAGLAMIFSSASNAAVISCQIKTPPDFTVGSIYYVSGPGGLLEYRSINATGVNRCPVIANQTVTVAIIGRDYPSLRNQQALDIGSATKTALSVTAYAHVTVYCGVKGGVNPPQHQFWAESWGSFINPSNGVRYYSPVVASAKTVLACAD